MSKIRIMLVDDIQANLEWARALNQIAKAELTLEVIKEAKNGQEAITYLECNEIRPDVVLMDIVFKDAGKEIRPNGLDAAKIIRERYPTITVLILSSDDNIAYVREAFQCGAQGYFLRDGEEGIAELCQAIGKVWKGQYFVSRQILVRLIEIIKVTGDGTDQNDLTDQQLNVAELYAERKTSKEIAEQLDIASRTVGNHITAIRRKLNATSHEEVRHQLERIKNGEKAGQVGLTTQECVVAVLYSQGLTCEDIAAKWTVPVRVVERHIEVVKQKLSASSSQEVKQRLIENSFLPSQ